MWCLLAVLAGLFAMHGLASSETGGCHLPITMTTTTVMPGPPIAMPGEQTAVPGQPTAVPGQPTAVPGQPTAVPDQPTAVPDQPTAMPGQPTAMPGQPPGVPDQLAAMPGQPIAVPGQSTVAPAMRPMVGSMCLFVAPAGWPPLTLALLALVTLAVLVGPGLAWGPWVSGRSPPDSGVSLLRRVCVSRT